MTPNWAWRTTDDRQRIEARAPFRQTGRKGQRQKSRRRKRATGLPHVDRVHHIHFTSRDGTDNFLCHLLVVKARYRTAQHERVVSFFDDQIAQVENLTVSQCRLRKRPRFIQCSLRCGQKVPSQQAQSIDGTCPPFAQPNGSNRPSKIFHRRATILHGVARFLIAPKSPAR